MPRESMQAFAAFRTYLEMEQDRTYEGVATKLGKYKAQISLWGGKKNWVKRAMAWDQDRCKQKDFERTKAMKAEVERAAREETIRRQAQQAKFDQAKDMLTDKIMKMLEFPLGTVTSKVVKSPDGSNMKSTTVHPAKWTFDTTGRLFKLLNDINEQARRNAGIADEGQELHENWMIEDDDQTAPVAEIPMLKKEELK
jgi:lipoprotein-anchoring transpeptidase ErfK/SrfK